jgi:hypothetical protein
MRNTIVETGQDSFCCDIQIIGESEVRILNVSTFQIVIIKIFNFHKLMRKLHFRMTFRAVHVEGCDNHHPNYYPLLQMLIYL